MKLSRGYFCKHRPVVALNSLIISSFPLCSVKREFGLGERRGVGVFLGGGGEWYFNYRGHNYFILFSIAVYVLYCEIVLRGSFKSIDVEVG